ncbi:MAG: molybdopterin-dependent oxidoreductase [Deltaproteobacteria bacterium]
MSSELETRHTFCRICEASCGLEVDVRAGELVAIRPDTEHVATDGFVCVKGLRQHAIYASKDRVLSPRKRVNGELVEVSWDQAIEEIGAKVRQLNGDFGPHAMALYVGTAAGFSVLHPIFAQGFFQGIGSRNIFASSTQDCANKFAVSTHVYGFPFIQPFPDIGRTQCLIIVGANPVVSKWSFGQVPNPQKRIREIRARGGRVVVVDPRNTETAKAAGEYVPIRAGTDVFFYLAFLNALIAKGIDEAFVEAHTTGFDAVRALVAPWTPERCADATGVPAQTLTSLVEHFASAEGAVLYSSTGVNMGGHGSLCFWLQEVINAVSGNLDREGGSLIGEGIFDFAKFGVKNGLFTEERYSRVGGFRAVNDALPGGILADEILTDGEERIRALFVTGGNPLVTMADAGKLREAFSELELLVTLDIFENETGAVADYILPTTTPLERADLPFVFPLFMGMQTTPYLQATEAVVPAPPGVRDEATIYLDLARACGTPLFASRIAQKLLELFSWFSSRRAGRRTVPQRGLLGFILRITGNGSFDALLAQPHGRRRGEHRTGGFLPERIVTKDQRMHLAPEALLAETDGLDALYEAEVARSGLRLITKRHTLTHNSWTHNEPSFVRGKHHENHVYMHPDDAAARGLAEGDIADVKAATASIRLPVALLDDLLPGTVAVPHGWGHQHASGLSVAKATAGVNVNLLAASGPESIERVSGMSRMTAIDVEVTKAEGPRNPRSWSGM